MNDFTLIKIFLKVIYLSSIKKSIIIQLQK